MDTIPGEVRFADSETWFGENENGFSSFWLMYKLTFPSDRFILHSFFSPLNTDPHIISWNSAGNEDLGMERKVKAKRIW